MNYAQKLKQYVRWDNPYLWAIFIRIALLALMRPHPRGDAGDFQIIAHNLADGLGFSRCWAPPFPPTSQRPPLFPLILSIFYRFHLNDIYGPAILNIGFDLIAMKVSEKFGRVVKLPWPRVFPWIIALCPMLVTMGNYPLTENLSVLLLFLASYWYFKSAPKRSGFTFGLLALCRSYYLLFPILLAATRPLRRYSRAALLGMVMISFAAPAIWTARNIVTLHRPLFSQTGTAGVQAYVGLCRRNFDWWDPNDSQYVLSTSPFREIFSSQCMSDDQLLVLNSQAWNQVTNCIQQRPLDVALNTSIKTWNLFINWGQIFPYDYVPTAPRTVIDFLMILIWARIIWIWRQNKNEELSSAFNYALLNIAYVLVITLPFGIDARYLLGPALLAFGLAVGSLSHPIDFVREPLVRVFGEKD